MKGTPDHENPTMAEQDNNNPAARLHPILSAAAGIPDQTSTLDAWSGVLGLSVSDDRLLTGYAVADGLCRMRQQLDMLVFDPRINAKTEGNYSRYFAMLRAALSPLNLDVAWAAYKPHLSEGALLTLAFLAHDDRPTEALIDPEEIAAIRTLLDELEAQLNAGPVAIRLDGLIRHQIEMLRKALDEYRIRGAEVLQEVQARAIGELSAEKKTLEKDPEKARLLATIWNRVNVAATAARGAESALHIGKEAWKLLEPHLPNLQNLLK